MAFMRNGSSGGIDKPEWPFGCSVMIFVITAGKQVESPGRHCGKSVANIN